MDGRLAEHRQTAWAGADVFCSLSDNIQETFGIVPIEAMAAGLPVVVSDWDGYKDTVRHGTDGFRIATCMPDAGLGGDLALRHALQVDTYDMYCGHTCSMVSVDIEATAQAFVQLAQSAELRQRMGQACASWACAGLAGSTRSVPSICSLSQQCFETHNTTCVGGCIGRSGHGPRESIQRLGHGQFCQMGFALRFRNCGRAATCRIRALHGPSLGSRCGCRQTSLCVPCPGLVDEIGCASAGLNRAHGHYRFVLYRRAQSGTHWRRLRWCGACGGGQHVWHRCVALRRQGCFNGSAFVCRWAKQCQGDV
ncbi:MAG: glycosyltransferase [Betaproteobacteria bacterium]|nr:glycosyltransferase [Betaproteobacteria bacterium]